jgi:hypothetical protein
MDNEKQAVIASQRVVSDMETMRALANPLRLEILKQIEIATVEDRTLTVKQLSTLLEEPVSKLYYNVNLLEQHDLIRVAETRVVSGIIEKHYQLAARRIHVAEDFFSNQPIQEMADTLYLLAVSLLDATRNAFRHLTWARVAGKIPAGLKDTDLHLSRETTRLSLQQAKDFHARLAALVQEFESLQPETGANKTFAFSLTTFFHPEIEEN